MTFFYDMFQTLQVVPQRGFDRLYFIPSALTCYTLALDCLGEESGNVSG
jgi:hypothetical protein